jgi:hypothetical protein
MAPSSSQKVIAEFGRSEYAQAITAAPLAKDRQTQHHHAHGRRRDNACPAAHPQFLQRIIFANVRKWHKADITPLSSNVRFGG